MSEASSPEPAASLEVLNSAKRGVRVEFYWSGDRFRHTILGLREGQAEPLLESIEGTAEDHFPPSPPFAELHRQDETIFLTGATVAGHWSMSIEPIRDGKVAGFLFDAACRIKLFPDGLTSNYLSAESAKASLCDSSLLLTTGLSNFRLEMLPAPNTQEQPSCQLAFAESKVQLTQEIPRVDALPTTVRWRYRLFI